MKKNREQEILELQEKVFGKDGSRRRRYVLQDTGEMLQQARDVEARMEQLKTVNQSVNDTLQKQLDDLQAMTQQQGITWNDADLERLQAEIKQDFGVDLPADGAIETELSTVVSLSAFDGVEEELNKRIVSQKEAIKDLLIALRRPYVIRQEEKAYLNAFLLLGPKGTGKQAIVKEACAILDERGILRSPTVSMIDLGLYNTQEDEKLFLQDIYTALKSDSQMLVFTNPQACFPAYLVMLASLFETGSIELKKRYVSNKEQLVETTSSFASHTISRLEAHQHYLALVTDLKKDKIIDLLGAEFMQSLADVIETKPLDEEGIQTLIHQDIDQVKEQCAAQLNIKLEPDEEVAGYYRRQYIAADGADSIRAVSKQCMQALTQYKLELEQDAVKTVRLYGQDELMMEVDGTSYPMKQWIEREDPLNLAAIKKELDEIVGLQEVKQYVLSLEDHYKIQQKRQQKGLKAATVSKHMIFTGNPGTGKTTIARLISKYLRAIGVLSGGQLVEVTRADLVGRYVGHTAPLTMQVMKSALGGVLFIDEAYSLYRGKDDAFGLECIDTIVKGIEDYRDDLIVILAGYQKEMEVFLSSNSGLKSRFPNVIDFKDYTAEELLLISRSIAKSKDYVITEACDKPLLAYFDAIQKDTSKISGNGRLARNKVEEAILNQARRVMHDPDANLQELQIVDFRLDESSFVE